MNLLDLMVNIALNDQVSDKLGGVTGKIKSGLKSAATAGASLVGSGVSAAANGVAEMGRAALAAYADYEQLIGGVKKLYGDAAPELAKYAQDAYKTVGVSANQYMQSVTAFSAAMLNSVGGDASAAAALADQAMQDIADNANTFGVYTVEELTGVYQALAKGQYQTLDNLNLGFSGTREGLQELLDKAEELSGVHYDIENFSDITQAIHVIQDDMHIAGATAAEAAGTISGSINSTKAAWANLLTELAKTDGDISSRIKELATSAGNVVKNMVPIITQFVKGLSAALPEILPEALSIGAEAVGALAEGLLAALPTLITTFGNGITTLLNTVTEHAPELFDKAGQFFMGIMTALVDIAPRIVQSLLELLGSLIVYVLTHLPEMLAAGVELISQLLVGIGNAVGEIGAKVGEVVQAGIDEVGKFVTDFFNAGADLIQGLIDGIGSAIGGVADAITTGLGDAVGGVLDFLGIASPSKLFKWMGDMTMQGLAEGIEGSAAYAQDAMADAAAGLYASARIGTGYDSSGILDGINSLGDTIGDLKIYLDGNTLVGGIAPRMDTAIGGMI